jgi:purine-binding chemotaxis protein CheW
MDKMNAKQFITFTVNAQEYGVDIMSVREIKGWIQTTTLPNTPDYVKGVINLRGTVVPILDVRARFGMGPTQPTKTHVVMILSVVNRVIGILVDGVSDILTIPEEDIRPVPDNDNKVNTLIDSIVNVQDRIVGLLMLEKLFDPTIIIHEKAS